MANKNWTAADIAMGRLTCVISGDLYDSTGSAQVVLNNRYTFIDSAGDVVPGVDASSIVVNDTAANLPTDVLSALQTIDTYLYGEGKTQEGM